MPSAAELGEHAALLSAMGNYPEARAQYSKLVSRSERELGPDDPRVAKSVEHLAWLHQIDGEYSVARALYERALAIEEKHLGPQHPAVASTLTALAGVLQRLDRPAEARQALERAAGYWAGFR